MLTYIIEVTATWSVLYLVFFAFLRKETYFEVNRWYLLSAMALGLLLPLLKLVAIDILTAEPTAINIAIVQLQELPYRMSETIEQQDSLWATYGIAIIQLIYLAGAAFFIARLIKGLHSIHTLYKGGDKEHREHYTLVTTHSDHLPFSFFNAVYISDISQLNDDYKDVISHELKHVTSRHTLDVLFIEIVNIVFWFHPLVYLYKSALRQTHEYLADEAALQSSSRKIYGQLLLKQSLGGIEVALVNHFFHSHIKNRINMMYQSKSTKRAWLKYSIAVPVLAMFITVFSSHRGEFINQEEQEQSDYQVMDMESSSTDDMAVIDTLPNHTSDLHWTNQISLGAFNLPPGSVIVSANSQTLTEGIDYEIDYQLGRINILNESYLKQGVPIRVSFKEEVFKVVEQMPRFKTSINQPDTDQAMYTHMYTNIKYPKVARENGVQGTVFVQFVVNTDGYVQDAKVVRDIGANCGQAVLDMIHTMNTNGAKWHPGLQGGKKVNVQMTIPVLFKLEGDDVVKIDQREEDVTDTPDVLSKMVVVGYAAPKLDNKEDTSKKNQNLKGSSKSDEKTVKKKNDGNGFVKDFDGIILLNGEVATKKEAQRYSSDEIATINMWKGEASSKNYPAGDGKDIISIQLKNATTFQIHGSVTSPINRSIKLGKGKGEPLFVIDGAIVTPNSTNDINPNDIKSIYVLKDEAAEKAYPGKGKNGVIEITLKEGVKYDFPAPKQKVGVASVTNITARDDMDPVYKLDGTVIDKMNLNDIDPKDIKSVSVYKAQSAYDNYPEYADRGVIVITTKGSKKDKEKRIKTLMGKAQAMNITPKPLMVIDGVKHEDMESSDILPSEIESMSVLKNEKAEAKYPGWGEKGVIEVTTIFGAANKATSIPSVGDVEDMIMTNNNKEVSEMFPESVNGKNIAYELNGFPVNYEEIRSLDKEVINHFSYRKNNAGDDIYAVYTNADVSIIGQIKEPLSDELDLKVISAFNGQVKFEYSSPSQEDLIIQINDMSGRLLQVANLNRDAKSIEGIIMVNSMNSGIYVLSVIESGEVTSLQFNYQL